jgi:23S rRNA (cytosine1962-C5)-methyltransferase
MQRLVLRKKISNRIVKGHPWIYDNEVDKLSEGISAGDLAEVVTADKRFVGVAYVNPSSKIVGRILTRDKAEEINDAFFIDKIEKAWLYRKKLGFEENCRVVFGEADMLPQLIIDKFNDYFVIQTLAAGIDRWKPSIVKAIETIFNPKGIYERNDVPVRALEGLPEHKGFLSEPFETNIIINENNLRFNVDLATGQKTGYFLDQQQNRRAISKVVKGAEVLGVFTYTGSFELHAAHFGARSVDGIDISAEAIAKAEANARLNGLEDVCRFHCVNAFDALREWHLQGRSFDVVMLDPPSFTKSRDQIDKAVSGYKEINLRGIKLVRRGGFLVTSSCTHLISPELFLRTIHDAAADAKRLLRIVVHDTQSPDHPVVLGWENTQYLKFVIAQIL